MIPVKNNGIELLLFESLYADDDVSGFVTTRNGAEVGNPYSSFNLGLYGGDEAFRVLENRNRLAEVLGIPVSCIFLPHQVHEDRIAVLDEKFMTLDADVRQRMLDGVDALITHLPDVVIGVTTADCVPILLYDEKNKVLAAIHAGWRGTVLHIAGKCLKRMQLLYKTDPGDVKAMIGPSIGARCFEVGNEVAEAFGSSGFDLSGIGFICSETKKYHIDLWEANRADLLNCGVDNSRIEISGLCTYTLSEKFYSARRLSISSGRFVTGIYRSKKP